MKSILKSILVSLAVTLIVSCSKEEEQCDCFKYTEISTDIYNINEVECQEETNGVDSEGYNFYIKCERWN